MKVRDLVKATYRLHPNNQKMRTFMMKGYRMSAHNFCSLEKDQQEVLFKAWVNFLNKLSKIGKNLPVK